MSMFTMQISFINREDTYPDHSKDSMWVDFSAVKNKVFFCNQHYIKSLAAPGLFIDTCVNKKQMQRLKDLVYFNYVKV